MLYMCTTGETVHPDKPDVMVATSQLHDLHNLRVPNKKSVDPDPFTLTVSQFFWIPSTFKGVNKNQKQKFWKDRAAVNR